MDLISLVLPALILLPVAGGLLTGLVGSDRVRNTIITTLAVLIACGGIGTVYLSTRTADGIWAMTVPGWIANIGTMLEAAIIAVILIVLIVVVFVIRPLLNKLLRKDETDVPEVDQDELDSQSALDGFDDFNLIAKNKELADQVYTINTEGGIELPNLRKEADLLKAVRTLASNEPQLTAEVIKDWLAEDLKEKS